MHKRSKMLALAGQPSLHGYDACMVYWTQGALRRNCRFGSTQHGLCNFVNTQLEVVLQLCEIVVQVCHHLLRFPHSGLQNIHHRHLPLCPRLQLHAKFGDRPRHVPGLGSAASPTAPGSSHGSPNTPPRKPAAPTQG